MMQWELQELAVWIVKNPIPAGGKEKVCGVSVVIRTQLCYDNRKERKTAEEKEIWVF